MFARNDAPNKLAGLTATTLRKRQRAGVLHDACVSLAEACFPSRSVLEYGGPPALFVRNDAQHEFAVITAATFRKRQRAGVLHNAGVSLAEACFPSRSVMEYGGPPALFARNDAQHEFAVITATTLRKRQRAGVLHNASVCLAAACSPSRSVVEYGGPPALFVRNDV